MCPVPLMLCADPLNHEHRHGEMYPEFSRSASKPGHTAFALSAPAMPIALLSTAECLVLNLSSFPSLCPKAPVSRDELSLADVKQYQLLKFVSPRTLHGHITQPAKAHQTHGRELRIIGLCLGHSCLLGHLTSPGELRGDSIQENYLFLRDEPST